MFLSAPEFLNSTISFSIISIISNQISNVLIYQYVIQKEKTDKKLTK